VKGYKRFIFVFAVVLALYIIAEVNRPKPIDWSVTLSSEDKNPYGSYILFNFLQDLFPHASVQSFRLPVYDQLNNSSDSNTAYLLLDPKLDLSKNDLNELIDYVAAGNLAFVSSFDLGKHLTDSLHLRESQRFAIKNQDSTRINFVNPSLHTPNGYGFQRLAIDEYLDRFDTAGIVVLGTNLLNDVNFIKIPVGKGAVFIHANPLCFSNYFLMTRDNAKYTAAALSYLPANIKKIYWDEYYKSGPAGSSSPMRFILSNTWLRWGFRLACLAMLIFVWYERKRRQRIIPVIPPLRNSTLDFVQTVGAVYFTRHDNKNIAEKKVQYLLEYIRSHFYLPTTELNEDFLQALAKKSGVDETDVRHLLDSVHHVLSGGTMNDATLLKLNDTIDSFYKKVK
jgi:hypothetical protein